MWLRRHPALVTTLGERAVTLAVCAGLQLLGGPLPPLDPDRLRDMAALRRTYLGPAQPSCADPSAGTPG